MIPCGIMFRAVRNDGNSRSNLLLLGRPFFFEISLADIYPLPKTTKGLNFSPVQDKKQITFRFDPVIIKK